MKNKTLLKDGDKPKPWFVFLDKNEAPVAVMWAMDPDYVCRKYEERHGKRVVAVRAAQ